MKLFIFLIFLSASNAALALDSGTQVAVLRKLPGASDDLRAKLMCLTTRTYPDDIEKCGLAGFDSPAVQQKIEKCLASGRGNLVPLQSLPNGQLFKVMMVVRCSTVTVAAEFEESAGKYSLVSIGELLD